MPEPCRSCDRREIDFRRTALVEEPIPLPPATDGVDGVKVTEYDPASFEVAAEPKGKDIELRAFLQTPNDVLTETWSYLWQPN